MRTRIAAAIIAGIFFAAGIFGMVKRTTYTDITAQDNYPELLHTAVLAEDAAVSFCKEMPDMLTEAPVVVKAKVTGQLEQLFGNTRQKVQVEKVIKGSGIQEDSEVYVFSQEWRVSLSQEPESIECGFVNIMDAGEEYLIFLSGRTLNSKEGIPMYEIYWETMITPVFCYKDKGEKPVKFDAGNDHTYVPYSELKGNEFFCDSEKGYRAWRELKEKLMQEYRQGKMVNGKIWMVYRRML